jgi:PAS domain-containing protein
MTEAPVDVRGENLQLRDHKTAKASSPDQDRPRGARPFLGDSRHQTDLWHFAPNMQTKDHTMINASHPGTTPDDAETASDPDSAAGQAGTIGDWAASLAKLLGVAFREVDTASLLLRVQIERSSFDPTHNRVHLEQDLDVRGQAEETLWASEERWRTVFEHASVGIALTKFSRSPGMAKGFTLYMSRAVISGRGDEVVSLAKTCLWR